MATFSKRKTQRGMRWDVLIRRVGYPTIGKSFSTKIAAELWASRMEANAFRRTLVVAPKTSFGYLLEAARPYLKTPKSAPLDYWQRQLGDVRLRDISSSLIGRHRDQLLGAPSRSYGHKTSKPRSAATVRRYLAALSAVFRVGIRELHIVETNPVAGVSKPPEGEHGTRFLSTDECKRLLTAGRASASRDLYLAVLLSLSTGLRRGELYGLHWRDVDLERRWAVLPNTKNGDARGIPLTENVVALLQRSRGAPDELVFKRDLTKAWLNALHRAEVGTFRWHDLRHSCASALIQNGANLVEVATLLGHRSIATTKRYAHIHDGHTQRLVDRVMGDMGAD